jgi:hypothetical protein
MVRIYAHIKTPQATLAEFLLTGLLLGIRRTEIYLDPGILRIVGSTLLHYVPDTECDHRYDEYGEERGNRTATSTVRIVVWHRY